MGFALILVGSMTLALDIDYAQRDLNNMQGTWVMVAAEREGEKLPDGEVKTTKVVIKGNSITVIKGKNGQRSHEEKALLTLKPSTKPKAFDLRPGDKGDKRDNEEEKPIPGIYELDGNNLKMCWAREGAERPREFATKPNSDTSLFILKRQKKE
jgi:uncharacterized protein (TIGR03067 family)